MLENIFQCNIANRFFSLTTLGWIDEKTREAAIHKAQKITDMIGYPEYILKEDSKELDDKYKDLDVTVESYFDNTIRRNAFVLKVRK